MVKLQELQVPEEVFQNSLISLHLKCMRSYGYIVSSQQRNKRLNLRKGAIFTASFAVSCCLIVRKLPAAGFVKINFFYFPVNSLLKYLRVLLAWRMVPQVVLQLFYIYPLRLQRLMHSFKGHVSLKLICLICAVSLYKE